MEYPNAKKPPLPAAPGGQRRGGAHITQKTPPSSLCALVAGGRGGRGVHGLLLELTALMNGGGRSGVNGMEGCCRCGVGFPIEHSAVPG